MSDRKAKLVEKDGRLLIRIPMKFKRRGGRKEIIVPKGLNSTIQNEDMVQRPLMLALARGHRWRDLLESSRYKSVAELAEELEMDPSLVRRHLRLTLLAPGIIEEIISGIEPDGLSLEKLAKAVGILWHEHQRYFNLMDYSK